MDDQIVQLQEGGGIAYDISTRSHPSRYDIGTTNSTFVRYTIRSGNIDQLRDPDIY